MTDNLYYVLDVRRLQAAAASDFVRGHGVGLKVPIAMENHRHGGCIHTNRPPALLDEYLYCPSLQDWMCTQALDHLQVDLQALERVATQNTVALLLLSKVLSDGQLQHTVTWDFSVHCCYPVLGLKKQ